MTAYVGNTNILELQALRDDDDDVYINDAAVTVTIWDDDDDVVVEGVTWPLTMDYVAASDGVYRVLLPADLALLVRQPYRAVIDVDAGDNRQGLWVFRFKPLARPG